MEKKITKREILESIKAFYTTGITEVDATEVVEYCDKEIAALDRKATKAKERAAAKKAQADDLLEAVAEALDAEEFRTLADITADIADQFEDVTISKISYRLRLLVDDGRAERSEMAIKDSEGSKSRRVKVYRLAS